MSENRINRSEFVGKYGAYIIVVILLVVGAFVSDKFFSAMNIMNILESVAFLGILAAGMSLVTSVSYTHLDVYKRQQLLKAE